MQPQVHDAQGPGDPSNSSATCGQPLRPRSSRRTRAGQWCIARDRDRVRVHIRDVGQRTPVRSRRALQYCKACGLRSG